MLETNGIAGARGGCRTKTAKQGKKEFFWLGGVWKEREGELTKPGGIQKR